MKAGTVVDRLMEGTKDTASWVADKAKSTTGKVVTAGTLAAGTLLAPVGVDHAALHAGDRITVESQVEQVPLSAEVKAKLASLFEARELSESKVNRAFNDPLYESNLDYIVDKLPVAREDGLKGVDLNKVLSLHPVAAHALVRGAYITYYGDGVIKPGESKEILDSGFVTNFAKAASPTKEEAEKFIADFANAWVIPAMKRNYTNAYRRGEAPPTDDVDKGVREGYSIRYKPKFDAIYLHLPKSGQVDQAVASTLK